VPLGGRLAGGPASRLHGRMARCHPYFDEALALPLPEALPEDDDVPPPTEAENDPAAESPVATAAESPPSAAAAPVPLATPPPTPIELPVVSELPLTLPFALVDVVSPFSLSADADAEPVVSFEASASPADSAPPMTEPSLTATAPPEAMAAPMPPKSPIPPAIPAPVGSLFAELSESTLPLAFTFTALAEPNAAKDTPAARSAMVEIFLKLVIWFPVVTRNEHCCQIVLAINASQFKA
jgi:hypothetical protein